MITENQKIINLIIIHQVLIEINEDARGMYHTNSQIKFKTSMWRSSLCDYSDAYILVSGTITVAALAADGGNKDIQLVYSNTIEMSQRWLILVL